MECHFSLSDEGKLFFRKQFQNWCFELILEAQLSGEGCHWREVHLIDVLLYKYFVLIHLAINLF